MSKNQAMVVWRLRAGADKRARGLHPWIYSNELSESPKGLPPGAPVELQDAGGGFIARGYGNPNSLIAFRAISRDPSESEPMAAENILHRLTQAAKLRFQLGFQGYSHRLCYGEADFLPGLVIDRYILSDSKSQIFAVQAHTAGADRMLQDLPWILEKLNESLGEGISWEQTCIVIRNDLGIRKLEGIAVEDPRILKDFKDPTKAQILVRSASGGEPLSFDVDLLYGQKTGFFLDQFSNIQMTVERAKAAFSNPRVLDLCCYAGQWSAQLAQVFPKAEFTCVDVSGKALQLAQANVERLGARCETIKMDVIEELPQLSGQAYDIVICDPPALIKGRKDVAPGRHGYLKLNTNALRLVRPGGIFTSCSCSGLFEESEFVSVLSKSARRNSKSIQWIGRGTPSPDHPMLTEFNEGHYLKCWVGRVTS